MKLIRVFLFFCVAVAIFASIPACDDSTGEPICQTITLDSSAVTGDYMVGNADITAQCLHIQLSHSGGCAEHSYRLKWNGFLAESLPPQAYLVMEHFNPGDSCEALVQKEFLYDLSPLLNAAGESVTIHLTGWNETFLLGN